MTEDDKMSSTIVGASWTVQTPETKGLHRLGRRLSSREHKVIDDKTSRVWIKLSTTNGEI